MGFDELKKPAAIVLIGGCICIIIAAIITAIILIVDANESLDTFHYGLDYNRYTGTFSIIYYIIY